MQDAIILYENGKAIGGEGHPTDADDITFNNTGTDIVANKVGSAIKEVNEKTKHGLYELWVNPNQSQNFAGQTITINNFDASKWDAIEIEWSLNKNGSSGMCPLRYEVAFFNGSSLSSVKYTAFISGTVLVETYRPLTISLSGTTLTISINDNTFYRLGTYGQTPTSTTDNQYEIPVRILGLMHND